MQELTPSTLNANTSLKQNKGYREFFQQKENYLIQSMPLMASGYLQYGGRPTSLNCGFRAAENTV